MRYLIKGLEIYTENEIIKNSYIVVKDGIVESIIKEPLYDDVKVIDMSKYRIIPGMIDMHIHGANGYDTMDCSYDSLNEISKYLAKYGVTSFVPTTVTSSIEKIESAIINVSNSMEKGVDGARILGSYIEGPYISEKYKGAHPEEFIRDINTKEIENLLKVSQGNIKVMTIAPEKEGSMEAIQVLRSKSINVSIGHTDASYDVTKRSMENGANIGVHLFNGMRGFHHREPGVVGALLNHDKAFVELICDTIHVNPEAIKLAIKCKGTDNICMISDCMMAGGLDDGEYQLGELNVTVRNSIPRLSGGSLAGSTLKLIDGIRNMIDIVGVNPLEAFQMCSLVPAKALKIDDKYGSIKSGKKADFMVIDEKYNVIMTIIDGRVVYEKP